LQRSVGCFSFVEGKEKCWWSKKNRPTGRKKKKASGPSLTDKLGAETEGHKIIILVRQKERCRRRDRFRRTRRREGGTKGPEGGESRPCRVRKISCITMRKEGERGKKQKLLTETPVEGVEKSKKGHAGGRGGRSSSNSRGKKKTPGKEDEAGVPRKGEEKHHRAPKTWTRESQQQNNKGRLIVHLEGENGRGGGHGWAKKKKESSMGDSAHRGVVGQGRKFPTSRRKRRKQGGGKAPVRKKGGLG